MFGGGLGLLDRRPLFAGSLLGLLIYKPHLGILIPVALVAGRRWQACFAAVATATDLIALCLIWLGPEIFTDYLHQIAWLRHIILEDGTGVWHRMLSVFVAARRLGADVQTAYVVQAIVGALAALAVAVLWFRDTPFGVRNAVLVLGTCLATPYLQDYDMVFGALVVAWLWQRKDFQSRQELPPFVASALILLVPLFAAPLAKLTGLDFGPLFLVPPFLIAAIMGFAQQRSAVPT